MLAIGDEETAAQAEAFLSREAWYRGNGEDAQRHIERAKGLVADAGQTVAKARVLCLSARLLMLLSKDHDEAVRIGTQALELAEALDLDEFRAHALTTIGGATFFLGDPSGEKELQKALDIALATNSLMAGTVLNNLSVIASITDTRRSMALLVESRDFSQRMGDRETMRFTDGNLAHDEWATGRWDEALRAPGIHRRM